MANSKIIIVGPTPPPYGGVAIYVSALYGFIRRRGVKLWTYPDHKTNDESIRYLKPFHFRGIPSLMREAFKARIIDSSSIAFEHPHKIMIPLWIVGKLFLRLEWVKIFHDGTLPSRYPDFSRIEKFLFHSAVKSVTEFVVVSEELGVWLRREIGVSQKVSVIKSLLPISAKLGDVSLPEDIDKAVSRHSKLVCSIGIFVPSYGFKDVADAVARIRAETGEDIGLILIDCGYVNNDEHRSEMMTGRNWITVFKDISQPLVMQILKQTDLFVRGVAFESYGLSRVEAIWCGVPVVATRTGEMRGMELYDYGDEEGLIKQMKDSLFNPTSETTNNWAELFQKEAEQNLEELIRVIAPEVNVES